MTVPIGSTILLLAASLVGAVKVDVPWNLMRELPEEAVAAWESGDPEPLKDHIAQILDDAVDLSGVPHFGEMLEEEQTRLAASLVEVVFGLVEDRLRRGESVRVPGRARALATKVVSSAEEAAAVLAMGRAWRALHPALVRAARDFRPA